MKGSVFLMKESTKRLSLYIIVLALLFSFSLLLSACDNTKDTTASLTSGAPAENTSEVRADESSTDCTTADDTAAADTTVDESPTVTTRESDLPVTPDTDITLEKINDQNGLMWYQFEEGPTATVLKSSLAQARDSILFYGYLEESGGIDNSGCAVFEAGDGIKLNNTFTEWGQITSGTFLHPATQAISVAFYIIPDSLEGVQMLFEYGSQYRGFAIGIEEGNLVVSTTAATSSNADGRKQIVCDAPLPASTTEEWTHIFFTYDGTLDGGTARVYVNLKQVAVASGVGTYLPQVLDASGVATVDHGSNSLLWTDGYYSGKMDDLRIYQTGFTEVLELEEGVVYLQSASLKNHYIKATANSVTCASMVEPAFRGVIVEQGLADASGVSLRMSGTKNYLMASDGKLIASAVNGTDDEKAATFYAEDALSIPSWGSTDAASFKSYRSMTENTYITADNGSVFLTSPSTDTARLNASFKLTGDQTKVIEGLRGAVYYPSYALNAPQFWKWYDSEIIERDMQYAKTLNVNAFRIWVSYEYWLEDPAHFEASYNDFLTLADAYGIKIMVSLFEGCGLAEEGYYSANVWSRDYTEAWSITSPCREVFNNAARWDEPKAFVTWFFEKYGNDGRHMAIEIYNEPWGNREACAMYLSEYAITIQGSVPITFGTAPSGSYNIVYSTAAGADMIHYHDNFPGSTDAFYQNAQTRINQGRLANLPVYCTEVQWVGGPSGINYPVYSNLAPTVNTLMETGVWAPFYWTLMVHPCYLDSYRNNFKMKNGIIQEDGSYYSVANAEAIAPEADLSDAEENSHNPYDDQFYTYKYNFSDSFTDLHAYKWTVASGDWSASSGAYIGAGKTLANATAFTDFTATFTVDPSAEAGLIFRAQDADNGYYAAIASGRLALYKIVNGEKTLLAQTSVEYGGGSVSVTVTANGTSLRISANCNDCLAQDATYSCGAIGFEANAEASFDSLSIRYLAE